MFTDDEIQAAVEQLVRTSVRRPYDDTGVRRTDITFSDLNDAAAGVFVLYPDSLYYVVKLAVDRAARAAEANQLVLTSFMEYVSAVARHVAPITSLNVLANARVALEELASASSVRESGFKSVTDTSAYERFDNNTQLFLNEAGGAVVSNGDVVPTPDEARAQFAATFTSLEDGFADLVRRATLLAEAVSDFDSMALPATLFSNVVNNSHDLIKSEYDKLAAMTPKERLSVIRTTVLNVLATRSTVAGFGNLSSPGMFYTLTGNGAVYSSTDYVPEHASITGDQYGPFSILGTANELDLRLDGDPGITTTVMVQPSFVPFIEGTVKEPYAIDIASPTNRFLMLGLKNYTVGVDVMIDITRSLTVVPADAYVVAADINAAINGVGAWVPLLAEPYCNPQRYSGNFDITDSAPDKLFTAVNPAAVDFVALGVTTNDFLVVRDVTSAMDRNVFAILNVAPSVLRCSMIYGTTLANETNKVANVSNGHLALRLRITDHTDSNISKPDYRLTALQNRTSIYIPSIGTHTEDDQRYALNTLGFVPLMEATARPTPASEVELTYNAQPGAAVSGVARTKATAVFYPIVYEGMGRTNSYDPLMFVAYKYKATCNMTGGTGVTLDCAGALTAGVDIGDSVVIRVTSTAIDVNKVLNVVEVTDTYILASSLTPVVAGSVEIEVGPSFTRDDILDAALVVSGGTANDGEYVIRSQGTVPFELTVNNRIPVPYGIGNLPISCTLAIGRHVMKFESLKEDLTASIYMSSESNPASAFFKFFSAAPQQAYATTPYYKPPSLPKGLIEGDMLELYTVNLSPTYTGSIIKIDSTTGVIELDTSLPVNTASMSFTQDSPVPFARIRRLHTDNYEVFSASLTTWLNNLNLDQNFMNLTRALNVLLVNTNPTPAQVNEATLQLIELNNILLDLTTILSSYEGPVVEQVDSLVKSFKEKGADRAADILLEGRFSEFFGLDQDSLSYTAYVQKTIKDVENNDLPIRKFDRLGKNKAKQTLLAEWDEQDFEFSKGDADPEVPYDPPGTPDFLIPR